MNGFASQTKFLPPCSILSVSTVRLSLSSCKYNGCMGVLEQCRFHGNSVLMMHPLIQIAIVVALPGSMDTTLKVYTIQTFTTAAVRVNMRPLDTGYQNRAAAILLPVIFVLRDNRMTFFLIFHLWDARSKYLSVMLGPEATLWPSGVRGGLAAGFRRLAESSSILSSSPLMSDSTDTPEEGSGGKSVWVTRFPESNFLLHCYIFSDLFRVSTKQCACCLAC